MKRFSWYTDGKPHISTYLNGAPKKRYLVVDGIDVVGRAVMHYKPNMKGGHRHNQWKNAMARMRKCHTCGDPIFGGITERLYFLNNSYQNVCRGCFRAIEEDARRHNYETIKEIEMMEADL